MGVPAPNTSWWGGGSETEKRKRDAVVIKVMRSEDYARIRTSVNQNTTLRK